MKYISNILIISFLILLPFNPTIFGNENFVQVQNVTPEHREYCLQILRDVLFKEDGAVKLNAAQYLLALEYPQEVKNVLKNELNEHKEVTGHVIGIWMNLAKISFHN